MSDRWLSVEKIADHLGISKDTDSTWTAKRSMPAHKIGRLCQFQKSEVDVWGKNGGSSDNVQSAQA